MIDDIFSAFEQLVGELPRNAGQDMNVLCPFHADSSPSMKLSADNNNAFCFSCRRSWTVQQFVDEISGQESPEKQVDNASLVDAFEADIISRIRKAEVNRLLFIPFFKLLDLARIQSIGADKLNVLLSVFEKKLTEVSDG